MEKQNFKITREDIIRSTEAIISDNLCSSWYKIGNLELYLYKIKKQIKEEENEASLSNNNR